jgi:hypothetical protein
MKIFGVSNFLKKRGIFEISPGFEGISRPRR